LPFSGDALSISKESATLNFMEAISWTNFPQLGCWHSHQSRGGGKGLAFSSFLPNALYQPGLATNMALWLLGRARWARERGWPDLQDQTMLQVLQNRFGESNQVLYH
jgi:hypothetical protein